MRPTPASWRDLGECPRADLFALAALARSNAYSGSASALTRADELDASEHPLRGEFRDAVTRVWTSSNATIPSDLHPWECSECGSVYEDMEDAGRCCDDSLCGMCDDCTNCEASGEYLPDEE